MRRRAARGQAVIEVLALAPVIIIAGLLAWQLVAVIATGLRAQAEVRVRAVEAVGHVAGDHIVVSVRIRVPAVLPGLEGMGVPARVGVRTP